MGRDLSYKIVKKNYKVPQGDFENEKDYDKAYDEHLNDFEHLYYCRNSWLGPRDYEKIFSRNEIIESFKKILDDIYHLDDSEHLYDNDIDEYKFQYTIRAFGEILSSMDKDSFVIIRYG